MPIIKFTKKNIGKVPHIPCVYSHYNNNGKKVRVGSTRDCNKRLSRHFGQIKAPYFSMKVTKTQSEARSLEKSICKTKSLPLNLRC